MERFVTRLDGVEAGAVRSLAAVEGRSESSMLRRLVEEALAARGRGAGRVPASSPVPPKVPAAVTVRPPAAAPAPVFAAPVAAVRPAATSAVLTSSGSARPGWHEFRPSKFNQLKCEECGGKSYGHP